MTKFASFKGANRASISFCLFISQSIILILSVSCDSTPFNKSEKISDILASPSKYNGKEINVKGNITESIIALGVGYFVISDGTSSITVIPAKTFPKVGEEVKIKGMVKNAFVIGEKSFTVIVEGDKHAK